VTGPYAPEAILARLRAVAPLLAGPARPALAVAAQLGEVTDGDAGGRLVLVDPSDARWRRVRVLADATGAAATVVLELCDAAEVRLAELAALLGEPVETWPPDARRPRFGFDGPDLPCPVEVTVRRGPPGGGWIADALALSRR
jgi:hypothetical protein